MDGQNGRTEGRMTGRMDGRMDGQMVRQTNRQTDGKRDCQTDRQTDRQADRQTDRYFIVRSAKHLCERSGTFARDHVNTSFTSLVNHHTCSHWLADRIAASQKTKQRLLHWSCLQKTNRYIGSEKD